MGNRGFECLTQTKRCEEIVKNIKVKYHKMATDKDPSVKITHEEAEPDVTYRNSWMPEFRYI
jgi:hypothetical protein